MCKDQYGRSLHVPEGERQAILGAIRAAFHDHPAGPSVFSIHKRIIGALDTKRCNNARQAERLMRVHLLGRSPDE